MKPILYGDPSVEAWETIQKGNAVTGGCEVTGDDPQWACDLCSVEFFTDGRCIEQSEV